MTTETYKERKGFTARERQTKKERDKKGNIKGKQRQGSGVNIRKNCSSILVCISFVRSLVCALSVL